MVVFPGQLKAIFPGKLLILNHAACVPYGPAESKFYELHVIIQVVRLIVQAIKISISALGPAGWTGVEIVFIFYVNIVLITAPFEKIGEI